MSSSIYADIVDDNRVERTRRQSLNGAVANKEAAAVYSSLSMFIDVIAIGIWLSVALDNHRHGNVSRALSTQIDSRDSTSTSPNAPTFTNRYATETVHGGAQHSSPKPTPSAPNHGRLFTVGISQQTRTTPVTCVICFDHEEDSMVDLLENQLPLDHDERWWVLSCNHQYHVECILRWSRYANRCPLCAAPLWTCD